MPPDALSWDILLIDIVGYSELSESQQLAAIERLTQVVSDSSTRQSAGLFLPTGDGMAVCFRGRPQLPLQLAAEVHKAYGKDRYSLKIGVHSGIAFTYTDITGRDNIAGSGINLAARVVSCCGRGHILVAAQPADSLRNIDASWKHRLRGPYRFMVKHDKFLTAFNFCDERMQLGSAAEPTTNIVFEATYVPLVDALARLKVLPTAQLQASGILKSAGNPLALDDVILEDPILGFVGVGPDRVKLSSEPRGPALPDYVVRVRDTSPEPSPNKPKVFLSRWDSPISDSGGYLGLTLGTTDFKTLLAWEHATIIDRLRADIVAGSPTLRDFQRRLTVHVLVITADKKLLLLRRSRGQEVKWEKGAWSASLEESMDARLDARPDGLIDPFTAVRRSLGKSEELGLSDAQVASADIRLVALGIEWSNLAGVLCAVVRLPTTEAREVRDLWDGAHDKGEHRCFDAVDFTFANCLRLLREGRHVPVGRERESDKLHRTAKIRILAALFNEEGYSVVSEKIQAEAALLPASKVASV